MYKYASSCFIDFRSLAIAYGMQKIEKKRCINMFEIRTFLLCLVNSL